MKAGVWRSDFFLKHLDWLRGCANLCLEEIRQVEVLLLQKWRKKFAFLSPHVSHPGKAFLDQVAIWNLYPSPKIYIKCWNRKKISTWDVTDIARRGVKHHPFRHYLSKFFTSDDDLQRALYSTRRSGRFNRKILRITTQSRDHTVPYCTHDITCRRAMYLIMELRLGPDLECSPYYNWKWCESIVNCDHKKYMQSCLRK